MPVKVKCPNCDKSLAAPDAARGKAIKCPECQTRIAVPADEGSSKPVSKSGSSTSKSASSTKKKPAKPLDSEAALATFDMRRAEDTDARICPKCGFDMKYQDEEDTECPQCGYDTSAGGMGAKARKKSMKGPDPDDFYPGLFKQSWAFVGKNQLLAWRTVLYTIICLAISGFCAFMYLWVSPWPPRAFLALCFTISFLVIPGWMWFLDTEVIKLTLERKDKFKRLNFDFFLASAMGMAFAFWLVAIAIPVMAIPVGVSYAMVHYNGMPDIVLAIGAAIGAIPAVWMLPVVMSHMSMPVQYKGWLIWKVVPMWFRNIKPLSVWLMFFLFTNILNFGGIATIAAVYGNDINNIVQTMEFNADIARKKQAQVDNPNARKKGQAAPTPVQLPDPRNVNFKPLIVPSIILVIMAIGNGFTSIFNMRTNGQFTYYFKSSLELVDRLKEKKYVAKESRDEDEDDVKSTQQQLVDAIVLVAAFELMGLVGGMLWGAVGSNDGVPLGIIRGLLISWQIVNFIVFIQCCRLAFESSALWGLLTVFGLYPFGFFFFVARHWEESKGHFFKALVALIAAIMIGVAAGVMGLAAIFGKASPAAQQAAPQMPPNGMMPNQAMPAGGHAPPGGPGMQGAHGAPTAPNQ